MYERDDGELIDDLYLPRFATYTLKACGISTVDSLLTTDVLKFSQLVAQAHITEADLRVLIRMLRKRPLVRLRSGRLRKREPSDALSSLNLSMAGVRSLAQRGVATMDDLLLCRLEELLAVRCLSPSQIASLIVSLSGSGAAAVVERVAER